MSGVLALLGALAAVLAGIVFTGRAALRRTRERDAVSARQRAEVSERADQQHRWAVRGDSRGVYGPQAAELMRGVAPAPPIEPLARPSDTTDHVGAARVAYSADELTALIHDKLPCWRYATCASVLVQRRAAVEPRLRDARLGFARPTGRRAHTGREVGLALINQLGEMSQLVGQVEALMLTPAFTAIFGDPRDESTADADGIVHTANRLMDYHERFLELNEDCRALSIPGEYAELQRDCAQLLTIPLEGYREFIDDFVARVAEMPEVLRFAPGPVELDPVVLHMESDDQLLDRVFRRLRAIAV